MRYVRLQTVITKVVDEEVSDIKVIKSILENIKDTDITLTLRLVDGPKMSNVRIEKMDADTFAFRVVSKNSILKKTGNYKDVEYVEINTVGDSLSKKPNISRFALIDASPSENIE